MPGNEFIRKVQAPAKERRLAAADRAARPGPLAPVSLLQIDQLVEHF